MPNQNKKILQKKLPVLCDKSTRFRSHLACFCFKFDKSHDMCREFSMQLRNALFQTSHCAIMDEYHSFSWDVSGWGLGFEWSFGMHI